MVWLKPEKEVGYAGLGISHIPIQMLEVWL
jgi:hypothetical protein